MRQEQTYRNDTDKLDPGASQHVSKTKSQGHCSPCPFAACCDFLLSAINRANLDTIFSLLDMFSDFSAGFSWAALSTSTAPSVFPDFSLSSECL